MTPTQRAISLVLAAAEAGEEKVEIDIPLGDINIPEFREGVKDVKQMVVEFVATVSPSSLFSVNLPEPKFQSLAFHAIEKYTVAEAEHKGHNCHLELAGPFMRKVGVPFLRELAAPSPNMEVIVECFAVLYSYLLLRVPADQLLHTIEFMAGHPLGKAVELYGLAEAVHASHHYEVPEATH